MGLVNKLVTEDSFDATGKFVRAGHVGAFDEGKLNGEERHLADISGDVAVVQIAPLGPTGPNPTTPQQVPPDAIQDGTGQYAQPGKRLVAEVTRPEEERTAVISEGAEEAAISDEINAIMSNDSGNVDNNLVQGKVSEVTADLGSKTDAELDAMEAQEKDNERPRKGVLDAIAAERKSRAENQQ
jgi:hypothetical protein